MTEDLELEVRMRSRMEAKFADSYLYVFGRTDLASMNPGKMAAHAAHAANVFARHMDIIRELVPGWVGDVQYAAYQTWALSAQLNWDTHSRMPDRELYLVDQFFGTTICLAGTLREIVSAVRLAAETGFPARLILDPTYPVRDGEVTHLIPVTTSGYVFGNKAALSAILGDFSLYP